MLDNMHILLTMLTRFMLRLHNVNVLLLWGYEVLRGLLEEVLDLVPANFIQFFQYEFSILEHWNHDVVVLSIFLFNEFFYLFLAEGLAGLGRVLLCLRFRLCSCQLHCSLQLVVLEAVVLHAPLQFLGVLLFCYRYRFVCEFHDRGTVILLP